MGNYVDVIFEDGASQRYSIKVIRAVPIAIFSLIAKVSPFRLHNGLRVLQVLKYSHRHTFAPMQLCLFG